MPVDPGPERVELPAQLRYELWRRIDRRLQRGEVLIAAEQFQSAMEREFRRLVRVPPDPRVREQLREMIVGVNEAHPETFLTLGIKNAITQFLKNAGAAGQDPAAQEEARQVLGRIVAEGRIGFFLESIGVELRSSELTPRIEAAIARIVSGQTLQPVPPAERQRPRRRRASGLVPVSHLEAEAEPPDRPAVAPDLSAAEQEAWTRDEEQRQADIAQQELGKAETRLPGYVREGLLTEEEGRSLTELYGIDARLARGEIDQAEADRLRSGMAAEVRERVQQRLREALDPTVHYLSVFEGLRRIPSERDGALRFLIRYQEQVCGADDEELSSATIHLEADQGLLDGLVRLMERRDHELRIIAAGLPPYRRILARLDPADRELAIEEDFVDELRRLGRDEMSQRLNSDDVVERNSAVSDIRDATVLLNQLVHSTPFHRAVRLLHIQQTLRQLYGSTPNAKVGRQKVQHYLGQRLPRLYPDLTAEERGEIEAVAKRLMEQIEQERAGPSKEKTERESYRVYRTEHKPK